MLLSIFLSCTIICLSIYKIYQVMTMLQIKINETVNVGHMSVISIAVLFRMAWEGHTG